MRLATGLCGLAALAAGCGELDAEYKGQRPVRPVPLSEGQAARYAPGGPERAVLDWFRALQRNDAPAAASSYAPVLRLSARTVRRQRASASRFFDHFALRRVLDVSRHGSWATVFAELNMRWQAPNGRAVEIRMPQAFTVVRTRRGWKLADPSFLRRARGFVPEVATP
jgi:hypothetical protein